MLPLFFLKPRVFFEAGAVFVVLWWWLLLVVMLVLLMVFVLSGGVPVDGVVGVLVVRVLVVRDVGVEPFKCTILPSTKQENA